MEAGMNCKPNDLAIIVRGVAFSKYIGRVVRVVESNGVLWRLDESLDGNPDYWIMVPDSCLRPIRDNPGQDETLTWAPHKETA